MDQPRNGDAPWPGRGHRLGVLVGTVSVAMLCAGAAVVLFITGGGDTPDEPAPSTPAVSPVPQPQARQTTTADHVVVSEAHEGIDLTARHVQFAPAPDVNSGSTYTSVWVRVENNTDHPLSVEASAFFLSDTDGLAHDPALGADVREIADGETVGLRPGDEMVGVVTALGTFQPETLSFYPDNSGVPVVADVRRE